MMSRDLPRTDCSLSQLSCQVLDLSSKMSETGAGDEILSFVLVFKVVQRFKVLCPCFMLLKSHKIWWRKGRREC